MQLVQTMDQHGQPPCDWEILSYGPLTVLFIAFVLQQHEHCIPAEVGFQTRNELGLEMPRHYVEACAIANEGMV